MFSILPVVSLALVAASSVSGSLLPRHKEINQVMKARASVPEGWATGYLESYQTYHARYLALDCEGQHNSTFFDDCCHPLLASEKLSSRPAKCTPTAAELSSASAAYATSTVEPGDGGGDEYCDEESSTHAATTTKKVEATTSPAKAIAAAPKTTSKKMSTSTKKVVATQKADVTTSSSKPASTSSGGSSLMTGGVATYFTQNNVAGACGKVHSDDDIICALQTKQYANGAHCGDKIQVTNINTKDVVEVTVADECPTCDNEWSVDFSEGAFKALGGTYSEGEFKIEWKYL